MARLPRLFVPGCANHVIQRGNNRGTLFFADTDRSRYLALLCEGLTAEGCALHAYVLMTNHVHLLVTAERPHSIPRLLQSIGRRYVQYVNRTYRRTGALWEGRFKSTIVDSEFYLLACSRYIEANPLRAHLVEDPAAHRWSSYRHNALGQPDAMLSEHPVYRALGASPAERCEAYRALFTERLAAGVLGEIRDATQRGWVLGSDRFCAQIADAAGRRVEPPKRGRPRKATHEDAGKARPQLDLL